MFLICLFMPASISLLEDRKINGKEKNTSDLILKYLFYTFLITTIMNTFVFIFSSEKTFYYNINTFSYDFCLKYMWLSLIIALILPYILKVISTNININLEIKKNKNAKVSETKEIKETKEVKKTKKKKNSKAN